MASTGELRKLGLTDDQIFRSTGVRPKATTGIGSGDQGTLSSLISEISGTGGAAAGAAIGSALLPGIGTLAGAGIGGLLAGFGGSAVEQQVRDKQIDFGKAAREGAIEGAFSVGPGLLAKGAKGATKAIRGGSTLADALQVGGKAATTKSPGLLTKAGARVSSKGDDLIAKTFRLNPSQQNNFLKKHGRNATDALKEFNVSSLDDLTPKTDELFGAFDEIATQVPSFKKTEIVGALKSSYKPLINSNVNSTKALGQQLKSQADDIIKGLGDEVSGQDVIALRRQFDDATRFTLRGAPEGNVNREVGSAFRKLIQKKADSAGLNYNGKSIKELGKNISELSDLAEITGKQQFLGNGSLPLGITNAIGGGVGVGAFGGPAGALGGALAATAANSGLGRKALQKGTALAGDALTSAGQRGSDNIFSAGKIAARQTPAELVNAGLNASQSPSNDPSTNINSTSINAPINAPISPELSQNPGQSANIQQDLNRIVAETQLAILEQGGSLEDAQQITQMIPLLLQAEGIDATSLGFGGQESSGIGELGAEAQKRALTSQSGLRSLDTLDQTLQNDPGAFQRQALPNPFGITGRFTGTTDVRAATDNVVDVIARLRSGAAITEDEAARFAKLLPQPGDSQESALLKLQNVRAELESFVNPNAQ